MALGVPAALDLGGVRVDAVLGGRMRLDGGAMFGVVPRPLWEPVRPPDARHRVDNACRCLLVRTAGAVVLVDTGCGDRFDGRARDIYAVDPHVALVDGLAAAGVTPDEVTHVVLTHLHFDHAGGALEGPAASPPRPRFPRALHVVQRGELDDARAGRSIMRSSYVVAELAVLAAGVSWRLLDGDAEVVPGVAVEVTGGHTAHHQAVRVAGDGGACLFPGDVLPTRAHLRPFWIMAYDMLPHQTLTRKQELARRAAAAGWVVAWDHDPETAFSRLVDDGRGGWRAADVGPEEGIS